MRGVTKYRTFKEMLTDKGVAKLLPRHEGDIESAVQEYYKFATTRGSYEELELQHGAVAIDIEPIGTSANSGGMAPSSAHTRATHLTGHTPHTRPTCNETAASPSRSHSQCVSLTAARQTGFFQISHRTPG